MISQHYYTRERNSLFSRDPGYGSIAKSVELSDSFIRDVLEIYCRYSEPENMPADSEESSYPNVYIFYFSDEYNNMVIGNGVYKQKDYTGERSTFFFHNLVLPASEADCLMRSDTPGLVNLQIFCGNYDISLGDILPQLQYSDIEYKNSLHYAVINDYNLKADFFRRVLLAVLIARKMGCKVYISLEAGLNTFSDISAMLMSYILCCVPYQYRSYIGFLSYSSKPVAYKGIGVIFVEDGQLSVNDTLIENDYVFIIRRNGYECNVDISVYEYYMNMVNFLLHAFNKDEKVDIFFKYLDSILSETEDKSNIEIYCEIHHIFTENYERIKSDSTYMVKELKYLAGLKEIRHYDTLEEVCGLSVKYKELKEINKVRNAVFMKNVFQAAAINESELTKILLKNAEVKKQFINILSNDKLYNPSIIYACSFNSFGKFDWFESRRIIMDMNKIGLFPENNTAYIKSYMQYIEWMLNRHSEDVRHEAVSTFITDNWKCFKENKDLFEEMTVRLKNYARLDSIIEKEKRAEMPKWQAWFKHLKN